jgi:hypothetical protein
VLTSALESSFLLVQRVRRVLGHNGRDGVLFKRRGREEVRERVSRVSYASTMSYSYSYGLALAWENDTKDAFVTAVHL